MYMGFCFYINIKTNNNNLFIFFVLASSCDLQRDLGDMLFVGCLPQNNRSHFQVLLFSVSPIMTWGLCAWAGSKRLSWRDYHCAPLAHTHTHTHRDSLG